MLLASAVMLMSPPWMVAPLIETLAVRVVSSSPKAAAALAVSVIALRKMCPASSVSEDSTCVRI